MPGCNVIPKHLEDVYLNWPYRISCYSLLYHKLDPLHNKLYMDIYEEGGNWESPMTTVSMAMAQTSTLPDFEICQTIC